MCGISGAFSTRGSEVPVSRMTEFLAHRGPDDSGLEAIRSATGDTHGTFAHRRLAILDLSPAGHQPMFSSSGRHCITYNGEIYNYAELRDSLIAKGVAFLSDSDTEVLLAGWELHGLPFLAELRGMFALAIWDRDAGRGFLARDRFGIKPLYVAERGGDVLFASEVRALLASGKVARALSPDGVQSYLATGSVAEPYTIIQGVQAVPPGCVVEVKRNGPDFAVGAPQRFAAVFHAVPGAGQCTGSASSRVREALRESVQYHLVSDVPVGLFLSGGLDSTAIAGLASEVSTTPIETFTVTFAEADYSEAEAARQSSRRFGTQHHEVPLAAEDVLHAIPDVFSAMDQPSLDGFNTFVVSRAVSELGFKVALSGLGGDELFGGYPSFARARRAAPLWRLPRSLRRLAARGTESFSDARAARLGALIAASSPSRGAYRASRTLFADNQIHDLTGSSLESAFFQERGDDSIETQSLALMQEVSFYETTGYMRNTLLRDSDVFSMAHGLEVRVPLVDAGVAAAALGSGGESAGSGPAAGKPLLVEAVRDLLSEESISSPKKGFTLPFEQWMRRELYSEVSQMMEADMSVTGLDSAVVSSIWSGFQQRKPGLNWSRPWALYTLIKWAVENDIEPAIASS